MKMRVAVGMSGGVDSGVAAGLLKEQGHEVTGLTMQIWDGSLPLKDEHRAGCFGPGEARDIEAARTHADRLGIPHRVVPLTREYREYVLEYFRAEYLASRTPNPCVMCNRHIKFGALLRKAGELGELFDRFATGHYARVWKDGRSGRFVLGKGVDAAKDQSYFLSRLTQKQLGRIMFPLGDMTKAQVRATAERLGWGDLNQRQESQDFIECDDYGVLFKEGDARPGPIVDLQGNARGEHRGLIHYTVGQRKGLGLGGGSGDPLYVVRLDGKANTLVVGTYRDIFARRLAAADVNWIARAGRPGESFPAHVRIRQQHREAPATVGVGEDGNVTAEFAEPQMSITPGQAAVFYEGEVVLGSALIDSAH